MLNKDSTRFSVAYAEKGLVRISDYDIQLLLSPKLRNMTQHHQIMCGCEMFIRAGTYQEYLNH